jgi:hypothetical protein
MLSPQQMVLELAATGLSDEQIAVRMGESLGGANPSSQAVRRWRLGRGSPTRVFREALTRVHAAVCGGATIA